MVMNGIVRSWKAYPVIQRIQLANESGAGQRFDGRFLLNFSPAIAAAAQTCHNQFASFKDILFEQLDFIIGQDRNVWKQDYRKLFENLQRDVLVKNYAPGDMLINERLVSAKKTLEVILGFVAREPVAR